MANSTFSPLLRFAAGYGPEILGSLKTGRRWIQPFMPVIWRVKVDYTDASTAGTTKAVDLNTVAGSGKEFPANCFILGAFLDVKTTFDGGATTDTTIQLGDTADPNELVVATSVHEDGSGATGLQGVKYGAALDGTNGHILFETGYTPELLFTSTSANLSVLTQGELVLGVIILPTERLPTS